MIQLRDFLNRAFDSLGDLPLDLHRRGAGPGGEDRCGLDAELGILQPTEIEVGLHPQDSDQGDHEEGEGPVADREDGGVHGFA